MWKMPGNCPILIVHSICTTIFVPDLFSVYQSQVVPEQLWAFFKLEIKLSKEDIEALSYAALLHDIGKIGISDAVLMKNGSYNAGDWAEMKTHPQKTKHILDNLHFKRHLRQVPDIAFRHHEKINGTGYPEGIAGEQITLGRSEERRVGKE